MSIYNIWSIPWSRRRHANVLFYVLLIFYSFKLKTIYLLIWDLLLTIKLLYKIKIIIITFKWRSRMVHTEGKKSYILLRNRKMLFSYESYSINVFQMFKMKYRRLRKNKKEQLFYIDWWYTVWLSVSHSTKTSRRVHSVIWHFCEHFYVKLLFLRKQFDAKMN